MTIDRSINAQGTLRGRTRLRLRTVCLTIIDRAQALAPDDRDLLIAVYADGFSVQHLARTLDPTPATLQTRAAALRRRVKRLTRRVLDPAFELVRTQSDAWSPVMARVGRCCFLQGLSIRETARHLRLSVHTVRLTAQSIRALSVAPSIQPQREAAA